MNLEQGQTNDFPYYGKINGTCLIIGYGSIGKGCLPLIKRHFTYDRFAIIDPVQDPPSDPNIIFYKVALTQENYKQILDKVFKGENGQANGKGFCVNVSVGTSSKDIAMYCQQRQIFYIDTVVEEWEGFYSNQNIPLGQRTNYALRHKMLTAMKKASHKSTAISCCGANPGMVSWFIKQGLMNIVKDTNFKLEKEPETQQQWARLMMNLGIKGIHVAERDTQYSTKHRSSKQFWNTWSVDGFISEGLYQASQLGWGTHEKWTPKTAKQFEYGSKCAIYMTHSGMTTKVKTWCPTLGPQFGFLVTHNQSISTSDYYTVKQNGKVAYRPTCHYAYHPTEQAISSSLQCIGSGQAPSQQKWKILEQQDIENGIDQLGVLIYGHAKNAYWYGSQLSIHDTKKLTSVQNATGLQVSSAVIAGMVWAMQNPDRGIVECQQMDYKRCLQIQRPYIEPINGFYTNWTPLDNKTTDFSDDGYDQDNPWAFKNVLLGWK